MPRSACDDWLVSVLEWLSTVTLALPVASSCLALVKRGEYPGLLLGSALALVLGVVVGRALGGWAQVALWTMPAAYATAVTFMPSDGVSAGDEAPAAGERLGRQGHSRLSGTLRRLVRWRYVPLGAGPKGPVVGRPRT